MAQGFDVGTYNLIRALRNEETGKVDCKREVNAFIEIPLENRFSFNMLKKSGVRLIERGGVAYAVGEKAVNIARDFGNMELRRPMSSGCVNPREKDGFSVLATMIHSLIGEIKNDGEVLCYSVPANALNEETDADYHQEVLKQIFDKYSVNNKKVQAYPINEALALVYAELQHKFLTGIGMSFGAGQINVCYANRSVPVFQFSLVNSGDWIDKMAAKASAVSPTIINKEKEKVSLLTPPKNEIERAIQTQYRILIRNAMKGIKDGFEKVGPKHYSSDDPIDIILAGGTSSPPGFDQLVRDTIKDLNFPIKIGEIKRPNDHLYAVARGCLEAAEASEG